MNHSDKLERGETVKHLDFKDFPFFEMKYPDGGQFGFEIAAQKLEPRTIKTHLPLCYWKDALDKSPDTKVIQTIRNPKDTLVSLYHFCRMNRGLGSFNGTWDQFFEMVENDMMIGSDVFQRNADWYSYNKNRKNSLILIYEDMKKNLRGNIKNISDFLGKGFSDNILDLITEKTTFQNMSKDPNLNMKGMMPVFNEAKSTFMRKGKVGDWKEYFNDKQNEFMDAKAKQFFDPVGLHFDYE